MNDLSEYSAGASSSSALDIPLSSCLTIYKHM